MFKRKKKKKSSPKGVFIIEEMVTDNNGLPIYNNDNFDVIKKDKKRYNTKGSQSKAAVKSNNLKTFSPYFSDEDDNSLQKGKKKRNKISLFRL